MEVRVSKMTPDQKAEILSKLRALKDESIPFHPLILVFSTGKLSTDECVPMLRVPMPPTGAAFSKQMSVLLHEAVQINPSIHDGAVLFARETAADEYRLVNWSMRIVSKREPADAVPNLGSAHNSALALSLAREVDCCCILSKGTVSFFEQGSMRTEASA